MERLRPPGARRPRNQTKIALLRPTKEQRTCRRMVIRPYNTRKQKGRCDSKWDDSSPSCGSCGPKARPYEGSRSCWVRMGVIPVRLSRGDRKFIRNATLSCSCARPVGANNHWPLQGSAFQRCVSFFIVTPRVMGVSMEERTKPELQSAGSAQTAMRMAGNPTTARSRKEDRALRRSRKRPLPGPLFRPFGLA